MEFDDDWNTDDMMKGLNSMDIQDIVQRDRVILKNIPAELTHGGLKNICEQYGTIVDINRPVEKSYAFVSFKSAA